jgi:hypothetical protein
VDVRPLRRPTHPTREPAQANPRPGNHNRPALPRRLIIGRRLPASSSFVLARALTGATGCGRSSLTRGRAAARNPAAARKASKAVPRQPDDPPQVTGPAHHALLTNGSPMGGRSGPGLRRRRRNCQPYRFGVPALGARRKSPSLYITPCVRPCLPLGGRARHAGGCRTVLADQGCCAVSRVEVIICLCDGFALFTGRTQVNRFAATPVHGKGVCCPEVDQDRAYRLSQAFRWPQVTRKGWS